MALKDFDDSNPRTRDKNWKEDISVADLPKMDEWYPFRILGGVFSYAQHWIEFVNKGGEKKRYPIDCANWDPEKETPTKKGSCPACEVGLRPSVRYMMNAIDRSAQQKGEADPIRALDIPPTVMRQLLDLRKLNTVKGEAYSITHPRRGCDVHIQKQRSKKRGGTEWQVQKGDRSALSEEEQGYELISFDEYWMEPDVHKIREDLKRHGYFDDKKSSDDDEEAETLPKKNKKRQDDDEDFEATPSRSSGKPVSAKRPADDDEDDAPPPSKVKAKRPPVDEDDDDAPPPKAKKAVPPPSDDDDEDDVPPKAKAKRPPLDDDDDAPPAKLPSKKKKPVDDDDDFDNDFGDV